MNTEEVSLIFSGISALSTVIGIWIAWYALVSKRSPYGLGMASRRIDVALHLHRCAAELVTEVELTRRRKRPSYGLARRLGIVVSPEPANEEDMVRFRITLVDHVCDEFWAAARSAQMVIPEYPAASVAELMADVKLWRNSYLAYNSGGPFVVAINYGDTSVGRQSQATIEIASSPSEQGAVDHFGDQLRKHYGEISNALKSYLPAWAEG